MAAPMISAATPALQASAWLHVAALGGVLLHPPAWPLALGVVVADHLALVAAGLWPRSRLLGPNWTRLPAPGQARREIAITLDDGPDPDVTPQVLDLLDAAGIRASFFVVGSQLERHRSLGRDILARGHTLENHSHTHRNDFSLLGPPQIRREIAQAQEAIAAVGGAARYFRAPAGLRNPFLEGQLRREGLELVSWTRRGFDTVSRDADRVHARLAAGLAPGDILLLHDGHAARGAGRRPVVLDVLPRLAAAAAACDLRPVTLQAGMQ